MIPECFIVRIHIRNAQLCNDRSDTAKGIIVICRFIYRSLDTNQLDVFLPTELFKSSHSNLN
jgi:hypothetical protein